MCLLHMHALHCMIRLQQVVIKTRTFGIPKKGKGRKRRKKGAGAGGGKLGVQSGGNRCLSPGPRLPSTVLSPAQLQPPQPLPAPHCPAGGSSRGGDGVRESVGKEERGQAGRQAGQATWSMNRGNHQSPFDSWSWVIYPCSISGFLILPCRIPPLIWLNQHTKSMIQAEL